MRSTNAFATTRSPASGGADACPGTVTVMGAPRELGSADSVAPLAGRDGCRFLTAGGNRTVADTCALRAWHRADPGS